MQFPFTFKAMKESFSCCLNLLFIQSICTWILYFMPSILHWGLQATSNCDSTGDFKLLWHLRLLLHHLRWAQETQLHYHTSTPHTDQYYHQGQLISGHWWHRRIFLFFFFLLHHCSSFASGGCLYCHLIHFPLQHLFDSFLLQFMTGRTLKMWMNAVLFATNLSLKLLYWSLRKLGEGESRPGCCFSCLLHSF